ncbi:SRPBCC domain-containing protein [Roseivirga sp. BDSF3-8]|uniref:SRPBCC domain-containing protein n=1 Tax=Roseivirga sp. BDSF3-8 TaxID=3241598 RepID=UPI003531F118
MSFQEGEHLIRWKLHLASTAQKVYKALTTDEGRESYWAEKSVQEGDEITFSFLDHPGHVATILDREASHMFSLEYFGHETTFRLSETDDGGTDLLLEVKLKDAEAREEMIAGWVSVLMAMKAAVDHGIDLRNHDEDRSWQKGFADN